MVKESEAKSAKGKGAWAKSREKLLETSESFSSGLAQDVVNFFSMNLTICEILPTRETH